MDRLTEMEAFATVVDQGGFTDAAKKMGISKSAVSKHVSSLEARLGAGRPVLLGLVGDSPDPFALHQVVGFAVERRGPLEATISVYDPNAPGLTRTVTTAASPRPGRTRVSTTLPTGRRADGRAHISTRPNHLSHVFVIDAETR